MGCCGCRITHQSYSYSSKFQLCSSFFSKPNNLPQHQKSLLHIHTSFRGCNAKTKTKTIGKPTTTISKLPTKFFSSSDSPVVVSSGNSAFSQKEDDQRLSPEGLSSIAGGVVALGKFDALHIGHRELAIQASKAGSPYLLSFVGMAEVLGWAPRAPVVAQCDRGRVLSSWAPLCGNVAPREFLINFATVRHLNPREFVEKLSKELGVYGVVAGDNYRFGYKAAGDATELVRLCEEYGMQAYIINSVMDRNHDLDSSFTLDKKDRGQVSSTRVRNALSKGDMNYVSKLLGRDHRLILLADNREELLGSGHCVSAPKSCLLNLPPKEGIYEACSLVFGEHKLPCRAIIDTTHILLELGDKNFSIRDASQDFQIWGIEFHGEEVD